jgi:hypothetical protein
MTDKPPFTPGPRQIIEAAPAMYKALKRLSELYQENYLRVSDNKIAPFLHAWAAADAALALAEGPPL